jgi:hypothetical protein
MTTNGLASSFLYGKGDPALDKNKKLKKSETVLFTGLLKARPEYSP